MGWLGWSESDAYSADVNSIIIAMEGKIEMLYPEQIKSLKKPPVSSRWKDFVKSNNARMRHKNGKCR